jgi:putative endonuclease
MYYVYIIWSQGLRRFYVGSTEDVANPLREHNRGESRSTRGGIPWEMVRVEEVETRAEAMEREKKIKGRGIGRYVEGLKGGVG